MQLQRWTPEQVETLRQMKAAGATLAEIADALNTDIGRVKNRMCWENRDADQRRDRSIKNTARKKRSEHWSAQEVEAAKCLVDRRATEEECLATVGRSFHACYVKVARYSLSDRSYRDRIEPKPEVSSDALREAAEHLYAPRSLTSWLCGDPSPSRSALAQKTMEDCA
jgi:hypothetical protein